MTKKIVLVTGTTRGLGLAFSRAFSKRGYRVVGCGRSERALNDGAEIFVRLDIGKPAEVSALFEKVKANLGIVDVLVNNAGVLSPISPIASLEAEALEAHMRINFFGPVYTTKALLEMRKECVTKGVVLNVSSGAAKKGYAGWAAYCASKSALDRFSECLALEEKEGLMVHSIAPGIIDTDMQALIRSTKEEHFPARQKFVDLKEKDAFSSASFVAQRFVDVAEGELTFGEVVARLENEKA